MAKTGSGDGWGWLFIVGGLLGLAWLKTGRGKTDSPIIPNEIEDRIDFVVDAFNKQFGHQWVDFGLNALQSYLQREFPGASALIDVAAAIFEQEQKSRTDFWPANGAEKRLAAADRLRGLRRY